MTTSPAIGSQEFQVLLSPILWAVHGSKRWKEESGDFATDYFTIGAEVAFNYKGGIYIKGRKNVKIKMVIDERGFQERIQIYFETVGRFEDKDIEELLNDLRIVVEQRPKVEKLTIIRG